MREIGDVFGIASTNGVADHLNALRRKGLLDKADLKSRAIRITEAGFASLGLRRCVLCDGRGFRRS
jgi:repressor LexA